MVSGKGRGERASFENGDGRIALLMGYAADEFSSEQQAGRFERYLKSGSGRAFAKRHFGPTAERTGIVCAQ